MDNIIIIINYDWDYLCNTMLQCFTELAEKTSAKQCDFKSLADVEHF